MKITIKKQKVCYSVPKKRARAQHATRVGGWNTRRSTGVLRQWVGGDRELWARAFVVVSMGRNG